MAAPSPPPVAFEIGLLLPIGYLPPLQRVFHTQAVDPRLWLLLAVWPVMVLGAEEARKAAFRRWVWPQAS